MPEPRISDLGESGLLLSFEPPPNPTLSRFIHLLGDTLAADPPPGLIDWVPGLRSLALYFDPAHLQREVFEIRLRELCATLTPPAADPSPPIVIPVRYGGKRGPDLEAIARLLALDPDEIIRLHTGVVFELALIGFAPGFPYLLGLPGPLRLPRRSTPRAWVAKGSVAIAGELSGIYPRDGPGGWSIIGQTEWEWFDPLASIPCRLSVGDRIRFNAVFG